MESPILPDKSVDNFSVLDKLDELLPDTVQIVEKTPQQLLTVAAPRLRQDCERLADNIQQDYAAAIVRCRNSCDAVSGNCTACYLSALNEYHLRFSAIQVKCKDAVKKSLDQMMGVALQNIQSLGVEPPNENQILEAMNGLEKTPPDKTAGDSRGTIGIIPIGTGCPPGSHLNPDQSPGAERCITDIDPPIIDPPIIDPPDPPDPPIIDHPPGGIIVNGVCCFPPIPAALINCYPIQRPTPPLWVLCKLSDCAKMEYCVYQGDIKPAFTPPDQVFGPYRTTEEVFEAMRAHQCAQICISGSTQTVYCGDRIRLNVANDLRLPLPNDITVFLPDVRYTCILGLIQVAGQLLEAGTVCSVLGSFIPDDAYIRKTDGKLIEKIGYWNDTPDYNYQLIIRDGDLCDWVKGHTPTHGDNEHPDESETPPNPIDTTSCTPQSLVKFHKRQQGAAIVVPDSLKPDSEEGGFLDGVLSFLSPTDAIKNAVKTVIGVVTAQANSQIEASPCNAPNFAITAASGALVNMFGGWFGAVPAAVRQTNQYLQNLACQYLFPDTVNANSLYIKKAIVKDEWQALVAANGDCIPWQQLIVDSSYLVPNPAEAIAMFRRGLLIPDEFNAIMNQNGLKDDRAVSSWIGLTKYVPGPSDLVHFMTRDAFDDDAVKSLDLDKDFDKKFTSRAVDWANAQGIDRDTFKYYWRSHWQIPSAQQMYEALHRVREDIQLPGGIGTAKKVTADEVKRTLEYNDMSPAWVERLIALSYRPYTRVDIRRMYEVGVLDEEAVKSAYLDIGSDEKHAKNLTEFTKRTSAQKRAQLQGLPAVKDTLKLYDAGGWDRETAYSFLLIGGMTPEAATGALMASDENRNAKYRAKNIAALRRRFLMGEYDVSDVQAKLTDWGLSGDRTSENIEQWKTELGLRYKQPAVAALCKWATRGYIDTATYLRRMQNIGYSPEDSANYINACLASNAEKVAAKAIADAKKAVQERKQRIKEEKAAYLELLPCKPPPKPKCETNG